MKGLTADGAWADYMVAYLSGHSTFVKLGILTIGQRRSIYRQIARLA